MNPPIHVAVDRWISPSGDVSTRVTATISPRRYGTGYARVQIDATKGGALISGDERRAMLPVEWPTNGCPVTEHSVDDVMNEAEAWALAIWQQAHAVNPNPTK